MSKRLTIEYVRESFELEGYTLLSKEYINNGTKLDYVCPKGHAHSVSWRSWNSGVRCRACSVESIRAKFITPFSVIKKSFKKESYTLISKEYKYSAQKLKFVCPNGHSSDITWRNWSAGHRCSYCSGPLSVNIDIVRKAFEANGYTLLSDTYKTAVTKLDYICPEGHKHSITWSMWHAGNRCPYCAGNIRLSIDYVTKEFKKEGYTLLSKNYKSAHTMLYYICPEGHKNSITWANWQSGYRCPTCFHISMMGAGHPNWKGGITLEPYCDAWKDKEYKRSIMERDENKCLNPYCSSKNKEDLTIHHINYKKKDCKPSNLITVCRSCNGRANKDREWHKGWYQAVLKNRYNIGAINHEQRT